MPSFDVYSDMSLIIGWFLTGHPIYALTMTVPISLQFLSSIYKWYQIDSPKTKKWSWILVILQFWPQFRALRVIRLLYKNDSRADEEKKKMMSDVLMTEPYLEALPSVMAMTAIFMHASIREGGIGFAYGPSEGYDKVVYGGVGKEIFFFTYGISIVTASLGMTKILLVGPCPILSNKGLLDGLLTWRFFVCFLGVLSSIAARASFVAYMMIQVTSFRGRVIQRNSRYSRYHITEGSVNVDLSALVISLIVMFIPNLVFSTICILASAGLKGFKIILEYPGLWLLPVVTYYTMGPKQMLCCKSSTGRNQRKKLAFSKCLTVVNMVMTNIVFWVAVFFTFFYSSTEGSNKLSWKSLVFLFQSFLWTVPMGATMFLSIIVSIIFLVFTYDCCCERSHPCCPKSCCGPECCELRDEYIDTNDTIEIWKCDVTYNVHDLHVNISTNKMIQEEEEIYCNENDHTEVKEDFDIHHDKTDQNTQMLIETDFDRDDDNDVPEDFDNKHDEFESILKEDMIEKKIIEQSKLDYEKNN